MLWYYNSEKDKSQRVGLFMFYACLTQNVLNNSSFGSGPVTCSKRWDSSPPPLCGCYVKSFLHENMLFTFLK